MALLECARLAGYWAWPALPRKSDELWNGLGLTASPGEPGPAAASGPATARANAKPPEDPRGAWFEGAPAPAHGIRKLPEVRILFPKIEVPVQ